MQALERARQGDTFAFEMITHQLDSPLRYFTRRLIGYSAAEDDILQNTFLALYLNLDRLTDEDRMRAFLFRVVRNQCYSHLRKQRHTVPIDVGTDEPALLELADSSPSPEMTAHWRMAFEAVKHALSKLPEPQQQVLVLYYGEHLRYKDIAERMHISIGTVKSRIYHARRNLLERVTPSVRGVLEEELQGENDGTDN